MLKKFKFLIAVMGSVLSLSSCVPSVIEENISFLNKHNVSVCYLGKETNTFKNVQSYFDLSASSFPDRSEVESFIVFMIDVGNKRSELSTQMLNVIYSSLTWNTYSYVAFFNFDRNLQLLKNTSFEEVIVDFQNITEDMLLFQNSGSSNVKSTGYEFTFTSEADYNYESYFNSTFSSVVYAVQRDLTSL